MAYVGAQSKTTEANAPRRVAITGIGVLAPGAVGTGQFWDLLTAGRTATRRISSFDTGGYRSRIAGEIDFRPYDHGLSRREERAWDRVTQFAVTTAREALRDSGFDLGTVDPTRIGISIGSAVGCTTGLEREYSLVSDQGREWLVDPAWAVAQLFDYLVPSSIAAELAWTIGAEGPTSVVSTGCTSGLDAVGHGADLIREGAADIVVTGASEAPISPITVACFDAIKATSPNNDDPEHASRPFDRDRDGFVLGEGSATLILEDWDRARARGAHIYAEFAGFATRGNAFHMTGLRPDGVEMAEAIGAALTQARVDPTAVDYVNAHGSGTKQNDLHETAAVKRALAEHARLVPMSSIKSMIGHSLGAVGSLELAASALAIDTDVIPPTANLHNPGPGCDLDYVPLTARGQRTDTVLSVGSGFGGFQSAAVLVAP
ncbi:beta-ketoacyl-[acyl-carrier-protein] synthase family protein [Nocardia sp. NPDC046763]|uniref:beta-ketoacyl-[acyl-carrier-protein] synthase family protein n=1 Tax=Nocardia sp. NPDC046763 TaxID=3155256 RepID=UPI003410B6B5